MDSSHPLPLNDDSTAPPIMPLPEVTSNPLPPPRAPLTYQSVETQTEHSTPESNNNLIACLYLS